MILEPLVSANEIEKIARNVLVGARAMGKFPTPVDDLIAYSELSLEKGIDSQRGGAQPHHGGPIVRWKD